MFKKPDTTPEPTETISTPTVAPAPIPAAIPEWLTVRLKTFDQACAASKKIFEAKEIQYDDAIAATGVLGAAVEVISIATRIKKMVLKSGDGGQSSKKDLMELAKDLHNYSNILMIMAADENWLPK